MNQTSSIQVGEVMTRNVTTIRQAETLLSAIGLMERHNLGALPVVDLKQAVCGILTTSDLIELTYETHCDVAVLPHVSQVVRKTLTDALAEDCDSLRVASVMTQPVVTISADDTIGSAAKKLVENNCHHLLVIDGDGHSVGIVSTLDLVRALATENIVQSA